MNLPHEFVRGGGRHIQTETARDRETHTDTQRNRGGKEGWGRGKAGSSERQTLRPRSAKILLRV